MKKKYKPMREYTHEEFVDIVEHASDDDIKELSANYGGYPVFFRMSLDPRVSHIPLIQTGSAVIVRNKKKAILLQQREDNKKWGLPGGCQDLGENLRTTAIRELYEETGIQANEKDLILVDTLSGEERKRKYPHGDIVYNNSTIYILKINKKQEKSIRQNSESIKLKFFKLTALPEPETIHDDDEINAYIEYLNKKPIRKILKKVKMIQK